MRRNDRLIAGGLLAVALAVASVMLAVPGVAQVREAVSSGTAPAPTAIVFVHGFDASRCPGMDTVKFWSGMERFFAVVDHQPVDEMVTVSYYQCDSDGYDITGDSATHNNPFVQAAGAPRVAYTRRTRIETLAKNLAWFVYNNYTRHQLAVSLVGHSMGGLIIREALQHVEAHDPAYPKSLTVPHVVTIASPFAGYSWYGCSATQCVEFAPGSAFIDALNSNVHPIGAGGTIWTVIGSRGCDFVTPRSATHMSATAIVYTRPCYDHTGYLSDLSTTNDATETGPAAGRHAIAEVWAALHR